MAPDNDTQQLDPWETGTGMADDFAGVMTDCFFGVDEKYNADAVLFCATLADPQSLEPITTIKYSVGQDWETNNDGSEIMHPSKGQINKSSRFGYFIDRVAKPATEKAPKDSRLVSPTGMENGLGIANVLKPRGTPFVAKTFEGLIFHWKLHKGMTLATEEDKKWKDVLYPVKYLGVHGSGAAGKVKPAVTAAAPTTTAPAPAAAGGGTAAANGEFTLPIPLQKRLTLSALEKDLKTFLREVGRDREVLTLPDDVMGHIMDSSANGFHAQANAS